MKNLYLNLLLIIAFGLNAQNFENKWKKNETLIEKGNYKKAKENTVKMLTVLEKFPESNLSQLLLAYSQYIKTQYYLSEYQEVSDKLKASLDWLEKLPDSLKGKKSLLMYKIGEAAYISGEYLIAEKLSKQALNSIANTDEKLTLDIYTLWINTLSKSRKTVEATELVKSAEKTLVAVESLITNSTSKKEKKALLHSKASFLTSKANLLLESGDYLAAQKQATENKLWLKKGAPSSKINKNNNHLVSALSYYHLGDRKTTVKELRKGLKNLPWKYGKKNEATQLQLRKLSARVFMEEEKSLRFARAVKDYEKCVRRYPKNSPYRLQTKLFLAERYVYQYRYKKAQNSMEKYWTSDVKIPQNYVWLELAKTKEDVYLGLNKNEEWLDSLDRISSAVVGKYGEKSPVYQDLEMTKASIKQNVFSDFSFAKNVYQNGYFKTISPNTNDSHYKSKEYFEQLSDFYLLTDKFDSSLMFINKGLEAISNSKGEKDLNYLIFLQKRAEIELKLGRYKEAQATLERGVKLVKSIPGEKNAEKANAYELLAKLYETLGQFGKARDAIKTSKKLSAKAKYRKEPEVAKSKDELAKIMIMTGKYSSAEKLLKKTLAEKEQKVGKESRALIPTLNLLGSLYTIIGKYSESEKYLSQSASLTEKIFGKNSLMYSENAKHFEKLYLSLGDYDRALEKANQNISIKQKVLTDKHLETIEGNLDVVDIQIEKSEKVEGLDQFLPKVNLLENYMLEIIGPEHPLYAEILKTKAVLYIKTSNNYLQADTLIGTALKTIEKVYGSDSPEEAEALMIKADIQKKLGKLNLAEMNLRKAQSTYADVFNSKHPGYVRASSKLAQILFAEKKYDQSMKIMESCIDSYLKFTATYFKTLSAREKNKYWSLIKPDIEFFNSAALQLSVQSPKYASKIYNNILQTKGILLSNSQKVRERISSSNNEELINLYEKWVEKRERLTELLATATSENLQEIDLIETEAENLEKKLSELSEDFKKSVEGKAVTWQKVKEKLKDNEYAVEITKIRHFDKDFTDSSTYVALVVSNKTIDAPEIVVIGNGKLLDGRYVKYYRNAMKQKLEDKFSYKYFWQPIAEKIPKNAKIYLSSDGSYNQLNVESLIDDEGIPIINHYDFVQISSTRDIVTFTTTSSQNKEKEALLVANPEFYSQTPKNPMVVSLKGAENESKELEKLLKSNNWSPKLVLGKEASKDIFRTLKKPRVIHIATHGFFKEDIDYIDLGGVETAKDPLLRSGLLMKGGGDNTENLQGTPSGQGILTAYEAMNLTLDNTELVVLSACETGLGEVQVGEGVFGLQRAFFVAGTDALVMSLFKVDDEATKLLMTTFYKNWIESGNKHSSFEKARSTVAEKFKHPSFWGSFVLMGME